MNKTLKRLASSTLVVITFVISQITLCMEEKPQGNPPHELLLYQCLREGEFSKEVGGIAEINLHILKYTAVLLLVNQPTNEWSVVCKEWPSIMKKHKIEIFQLAICQVYEVGPEICERFLKGKLIYKPNEGNDIGRIDLRISDLANPLEGTFDLSRCRDTGKYLSISTGYRKGKKAENKGKTEIWFTPRFLVEKEINGNARHFQDVFPKKWADAAPVGIFWTWANVDHLEWYDYLTSQSLENISNGENLYKKWAQGKMERGGEMRRRGDGHFQISF